MIRVSEEYDGINAYAGMVPADPDSRLYRAEYELEKIPCFSAGDPRVRFPGESQGFILDTGDRVSWGGGPKLLRSGKMACGADKALRDGRLWVRHQRTGKTYLTEGMFNLRDKLPRIGIVRTVSGTPVPLADVILYGINHREIAETDNRGIWWKYLEIDEYDDALIVSINGMVYRLIEQIETAPDSCIFDQTVQRRTAVSGPYRMIRRRMV